MKRNVIRLSVIFSVICLIMTACKDGDTIYQSVDLPTVAIELVGSPSSDEIEVLFKPGEGTARVVYAIGSEQDRQSFLAGNMPGTEQSTGQEEFTKTFSGLTEGQRYVVYAVGFNSDGTQGGVASVAATTVFSGGFGVDIQYVSDKSAGIHMFNNPSMYYAYVYHLGTESDRQDVLNQNVGEAKVETGNFTANYFDLTPSTDYIFFVLALSRYGDDELFELPVSTLAEGTAPAVTFSGGGNAYYIDMTLEPNSHAGKTLIAASETYNNMRDLIDNDNNNYKGDIFAALEAWSQIIRIVAHIDTSDAGTLNTTFQNYSQAPGQGYLVYALSYDKDGNPANVQAFDFENTLDQSATQAAVTIEMLTNTLSKVEFRVTPSANTYAVYYNVVDADDVDLYIPDHDPLTIYNSYLSYNGYYTGPSAEPFIVTDTEGLEAGRRAYFFVMPANQNGTQGLGQLAEFEFTLPNS